MGITYLCSATSVIVEHFFIQILTNYHKVIANLPWVRIYIQIKIILNLIENNNVYCDKIRIKLL